ncbi:MAG: hypothetical protein ACI4U9_04905 [Clostridia bacterium]
MKVKKVLRKVWSVLYWIAVCDITLRFIMGKADVMCIIAVCITYAGFLLNGILSLVKIISTYKAHKVYKEGYDYLKAVHKARYKLYFSGDKEEIETYSKEIERYGNILISIGEDRMKDAKLSKKIRKEIQEIIDGTKKLMTTTQSV